MTTEPTDLDGDVPGAPEGHGGGPSWTRRGLIAGVAAAGVGAAIGAAGGVGPAGALTGGAQGGDLVLGEANTAAATTEITTTGGAGLLGITGASSGLVPSVTLALAGLIGDTDTGYGVIGASSASSGVWGVSDYTQGVLGDTSANGEAGVRGFDNSTAGGYGVIGISHVGIGVEANGGLAPLRLVPGSSAGAPASGTHSIGEIYLDENGVLYQCTATGSPGTWIPVVTTGALELGEANTSTGTTQVTTSGDIGLYGVSSTASGQLAGDSAGVVGDSSDTFGVIGLTSATGYAGVYGVNSGDGSSGVYGADSSPDGGRGVVGQSSNGTGVLGNATSGVGVLGWSGPQTRIDYTTAGVVGDTRLTTGVLGLSGQVNGVHGIADGSSGLTSYTPAGVVGESATTPGVTGLSTAGYGVVGLSQGSAGVYGTSDVDGAPGGGVVGVDTSTTGSSGVSGQSTTGTGVTAVSTDGYGTVTTGGLAPLLLTPASSAGAPTTGAHMVGELYTDSAGSLFYCVAHGTPGTWLQVASAGPPAFAQGAFCLLPAPIRLLDTRIGAEAPDHPGRPVTGGSFITVPITGQAVGTVAVPDGAVAVIGNVTAVNALAHGYLTLWPYGVTQPTTSSLNYPAAVSVANGVTVALSADGKLDIYASQTTDVIFDATGFIA